MLTRQQAIAEIFNFEKTSLDGSKKYINSKINLYLEHKENIVNSINLITDRTWNKLIKMISEETIQESDSILAISINRDRMHQVGQILINDGVDRFTIKVLLENLHYLDRIAQKRKKVIKYYAKKFYKTRIISYFR